MPTQRGLAYSGLIAHTCWPMGISIFGAAPKSDSQKARWSSAEASP
jgi:hypothetical protein